MNELKPCPFCGYPAVFEPFKERKGYAATVRCCNCLAEITTITYDTEKEAEIQAVFAWNRRANEDAPTADVVEVVRCKDCEECDKDDLKKGHATVFCFHHGSYVPLRYFCGSGKRREK